MKNTKLKILSIPFIFGIVTILLPSNNSYSDNTVEKIQSSVVYDNQIIDRGLDEEIYDHSALGISNEQDDSEMEIMSFSISSYSVEEPIVGITKSLSTVDSEDVEKLVDNNYMWTTDRVNLRSEASTNSDKILTLDKRTKIQMISSSNKWTKVKYEDYEGYIYSTYLRDSELFTSTNNRWGIELTDTEIDLLAKILWTEARSESDEGNWAVVECILNRMVALQYPDTLKEVLSQDKQFSSWGIRDKAKYTERELELIEEVLRGDTDVLSMNVMYFSTSPRNKNVEVKIGNHYFCEEVIN